MCIVNLYELLISSMGNKSSCCADTSPPLHRKDVVNRNNDHRNVEDGVGNLQHISEREPEDWDTDPSLHPKARTIFLEKSKLESKMHALCRYIGLFFVKYFCKICRIM